MIHGVSKGIVTDHPLDPIIRGRNPFQWRPISMFISWSLFTKTKHMGCELDLGSNSDQIS